MAKETEVGPRGKKEPKELSRREFVKGAAVGAVAVAGAGALASCAAPTPEVIKETVEVPVEVTKIVEVPAEAGPVTLEVLNPIAVMEIQRIAPAPRLTDLNNKRIGLHWNTKARGNVALQRVKELLEERFTGVEVKLLIQLGGVLTPHSNTLLGKEELDEIAQWKPDAIVASTAD